MKTCRTWRIHAIGGPENLRLDALPMPQPGPGEVRVRVRACGLNRSDLLWIGGLSFVPIPPARVGYEICGEIDALGPEVAGWKIGQRVSNLITFNISDYGNFAEYAILPVTCLVPTPESLSDISGAAFTAVYLTGYLGLIEFANLSAGERILITAGSSANGLTAIPVARRAGALVIATTRHAAKRDMLWAAGADHVIVTENEDMSQAVAQITGGTGCDVIYDCVGGQLTASLLQSIATGGRWIQYGFLDPSPVQVIWPEWFRRQPQLSFFSLPRYTGDRILGFVGIPEAMSRARRFILEGVAAGYLPIPISREFQGIETVPDAFRAVAADTGGGKVVIQFGQVGRSDSQ